MWIALFLASLVAAFVPDVSTAVNSLGVSIPQWILGTRQAAFGGLNILRDSRTYAAMQRGTYYMNNSRKPPADNSHCIALYAQKPEWYARFEDVQNKTQDTQRFSLITALSELDGWTEQSLECLLYIAYEPMTVPVGLAASRLESWLGIDWLADLAASIWNGVIITESKCDGADGGPIHIGFSQQGITATAPFVNYIGNSEGHYLFGTEIMDDRDWWWMDWTQDFESACRNRAHRFYDAGAGKWKLVGPPNTKSALPSQRYTTGALNNSSLMRDRLSQLRWVGYDPEINADLYLARHLVLLPEGFRTIMFTTFVLYKKGQR